MTKLPQSLPQQLVHVSVTPDDASDQTHPRSHRLAAHPQHTNLAHGRKTATSPVSPVFVRVHATGRRPGSFHICSRPRSSNAPASLCNQDCKNHSPRSLHAPTSPVTSPETTTAQPITTHLHSVSSLSLFKANRTLCTSSSHGLLCPVSISAQPVLNSTSAGHPPT